MPATTTGVGSRQGAIVATRVTVIPVDPIRISEMTTRVTMDAVRSATSDRVVALLAGVVGIVGA